MVDIAFKIDGNQMTNQPSSLRDIPTQPHVERLPGGAEVASPRKEGSRVVVTWGGEATTEEAVSELLTALGTPHTLKHQITWTDPVRGAQTREMYIGPLVTTYVDGRYDPVTLTFGERPG